MTHFVTLESMMPVSPPREEERGALPDRLVDRFGRVHTNLRISITDRCDFRCVYCMPEEMEFFPREHLLTYEEIVRLVRIAARLGVDKVRLTGGEPLVRRDVTHLVEALSRLGALRDLSLTTNGARLAELAQPLWEAGLRRINVSLDSLDPVKFARITRRDMLDRVLAGLAAAARVGFRPIKVNVVAIRDFTEEELLDFARLAREGPYEVRFIEFMPLDGDDLWDASRVLPAGEILARIGAAYPLERVPGQSPSDPATLYRFTDGSGQIGIIPTVTEPFCAHCNRIRITSDGMLRYCLFALEETDLKTPLRAGASDEEIAWRFVETVRGKWAGHLIQQAEFVKPRRTMSQIGG